MDCKDCYKNGRCWACVKWFGCSKPHKEDECFKCDRAHCPKDKEDINECMSLPVQGEAGPAGPQGVDGLLTCPFCGTVPEIEEIKSKGGLFRKKTTCFYVRCPVCRATSGVDYKKNKVAYLWNRRVENE